MNEFSFIDLINDLASSRPDGISEDEREELVENAIDLLSNNLDNRRALADHTGAYHTSINKKLRVPVPCVFVSQNMKGDSFAL